jgi:hypothetical protein
LVQTEFGLHADQSPAKHKASAHSKLRKATRTRIRTLEKHGSRPYVRTNFTGKAQIGDREYHVGNVGEADLEVVWFGQGFQFEIKAEGDSQRRTQEKAERLFQAAGGIYLIVRQPHEATDCMLQWAARVGKIF